MAPMRTSALLIWVLAAACGGAPATTAEPKPAPVETGAAAELSPALAPLAWWLGDWEAADGESTEHWVAAAGAIYGVSLQGARGFEVMIVDDGEGRGEPDGVLRFIAMPGGRREVEFRGREVGVESALFANDDHDFPKTIRYFREGEALRATLGDGAAREAQFRFRPTAPRRAPELEAADRAFAADVAERGVAAWVAAFDPEGWMMKGPGEPVSGDALGELMRPTLTGGRLAWAPIASGRNEALGFTVGKGTYTAQKPEESRRSSYVTIWRKQADGTWKVLFDTGRVVQAEPGRSPD
jgi:hypothetical protein